MRLALAQVNPIVGDLEGNVTRCLAAADAARRQSADLVLLPEMVIPGYPPRDILLDASFVEAAGAALADLAWRARGGPPLLAGCLAPSGRGRPGHPGLYNAAFLLRGGKAQLVAAKRLLPGYDVFYEPRWFLPGPSLPPVEVAGRRAGVLVCEDLWDEGYDLHPPAELQAAGAELLLCLAASPFRRGVGVERLHHARRAQGGCPLAYANLVGANDELIFDGASFCLDGQGRVVARLAACAEEVQVVELPAEVHAGPVPDPAPQETDEELFRALVLGVRDFGHKNGIRHAFIGLSGGVDSAVVAVLAAAALGPGQVTAVALPSRYTDPRSTAAARDLAAALGLGLEVVDLEPLHAAVEASLGPLLETGTTAENAQARLRALVLMAFVNSRGGLLLNTSNKTELALGYSTLYGDMAGSLCPIADLTKPEVYSLARWINATQGAPIPPFVLYRPPSAELRPDQVDPFDYPVVAPQVERLVRDNRSDAALRRSEHKRWQAGVILKVSDKAFGTGRMMPITRR